MINVAHIVENLKIGGLERVIACLVPGLDKKAFQARIWCLAGKGEIFEQLALQGEKIELLGMRSSRDFRIIRVLVKKLKQERIQIVHTHGYTAATLGRLAAILAGVGVIIAHRHTDYSERNFKRMFIDKFLNLFTKKIICCSQAVADYVINQEKVPAGKVTVIYNGATNFAEISAGQDQARENDEFVVGCVASLFPHKGHKYLLEAAVEAQKSLQGKVKFVLVGTGILQDELKRYARDLGLENKVIFQGVVKNIVPLVSSFDCLVLPSTLREGLGLSLIEAMALAKPVIGTLIGGIPEVIEDGKNGFLVPPRNAHSLAEAIITLVSDRQKAKDMGRAGQEIAKEKFSAAVMVQQTEQLYFELLGCKLKSENPAILFTSSFADLQGGGQRSLLLLLKFLDKQRFEPILLVPEEGELAIEARKLGVRTEALSFPQARSIKVGKSIAFFFRLLSWVKERNIAIIHTESPREFIYLALVGKLTRIPVIFHARVSESFEWLDWLIYRLAVVVIAVSRQVAGRFSLNSKPEKVKVVFNGVDLEEYKPAAGQEKNKIFRIGYFGRIHPRKGLETLIEAVGKLRGKAEAVIQGDGQAQYVASLKKLSAGLPIEFKPYVFDPREDIAKVDAVVLPSVKGEGLSRILLEALALGKVPIVSDFPENIEVLGEDFKFLAFPVGDAEKLAQLAEKMRADELVRTEIKAILRSRAEKLFDIRKTTRQIENVYNGLFSCGGRKDLAEAATLNSNAEAQRQPYFICPVCKNRLFARAGIYFCLNCASQWPVKEGIPVFLKNTPPYWGEFSAAEMDEINGQAKIEGWNKVIQSRFPAFLRDFILEENRGNWRYFVESNTGGTVLDIGSGWGTLAFSLAKTGSLVYALEPVWQRVEFIKIRANQEQLDNLKPVCAGVRSLPFPDVSFDVVILNGVLEWLGVSETDLDPNRGQEKCLEEVFRVLKPGGSVYIGVENRFAFFYFLGVKDPHSRTLFTTITPRPIANLLCRMQKGKPYRTYIYSLSGYRRLLRKAGFNIIDFYLPVPAYLNIKYLVPLNSPEVFNFWLGSLIKKRILFAPWLVRRIFILVRIVSKFPVLKRLVKYVVPDFAIIARKDSFSEN